MEEILDQALNEKEKDETRINRFMAMVRLIVSALFVFLILKLWYLSWHNFNKDMPEDINALIMSIFMLGMVVYNTRQLIVEWKNSFVYPKFSRSLIAVFIFLNSIITFVLSFFLYVVFFLQKQSLSSEGSLQLILVICLPIIVFREITYFRRATRLKRLKNSKP